MENEEKVVAETDEEIVEPVGDAEEVITEVEEEVK